MCRAQLDAVRREHPDGTEFLTSAWSDETNSETQPWCALALHPPEAPAPTRAQPPAEAGAPEDQAQPPVRAAA